jgi:hypothetical protein
MERKPYCNDTVLRKWPPIFRDGIKIVDDYLGILEISIHGEVEIAAKDLKQMEKLGYIHDKTNVYPCIPKFLKRSIDIKDDLSEFLVTSVTFREYQAPPLENDGKADRYVPELSGIWK